MDLNSTIKSEITDYLNTTPESTGDQKRRSSSRSIKRKRFDDEIVEYSLGIPPTQVNRLGRARTQSQSSSYVTFPSTEPTVTVAPPPAPVVIDPAPPVPLTVPPVIVPPVSVTLPVSEKRRSVKPGKKSRRNRGNHQITTKDLGRWKPIDDLALIIGIQQTNDLKTVHRGTKFSCKFTLQELQSRWYSLLYEEPISRLAVAAMRNLHPEMIESVQSKALYTQQEEDLLATIKSTEQPTIEVFQELLDKNPSIFYSARTAKALYNHWQLMKQYSLLPDQIVLSLSKSESVMSFSDAEDLINDNELLENRDEQLEIELALADRKNKKEIRHLENELSRWTVLVDSLTGIGFTPEFDNQTLAVLRGRLVRYLMRSREITFGRGSLEFNVDVDFSLEGPAYKVSRKQGTIKLRSNGDFFISNEGRRPVFIEGNALLQGQKSRLNNNSVIEISGLRFVFLINSDLINAIRHESAKMNMPVN